MDGSTGTVNTGNTGQIAYYASNGPAVSGMAAVPVSAGGTGATTTAGALAALGAQASIAGLNGDGQSTPGIQVAGTVAAGTSVAKNSASIGPRYDVTQFGAVGNGSTDDTAAVQAAFDACWGNGTGVQPYGGIVQFPGNRTYKTTATLNAYNGCRIEGTGTGAAVGGNAQAPPNIMYSGTGDGVTASITGFTEAANSVPYYPRYSPHPSSSTVSPAYASIVTFTTFAANPYTVGQWVYINGFTQTTAGKFFNQFVSQVVAVTTNSFTTTIPYGNSGYGSYVDTATAVSTSVAIATDSLSRYEDSISGVQITFAGVGVFKGDRVDTGTHFQNVRLEAQGYFGIYFSGGGSSIDFDKGWRIESSGIAGLYWKGTGGFSMENGQFTTSSGYKGAGIMLDNQSCLGAPHVSLRSMAFEIVSNYNAGMGGIVMLDCPSTLQPGQFNIDMVGVNLSADSGVNGHDSPTIVMSPPNDSALSLSVVNSLLMSSATNPRWVGVPALARQDMALNSSSTSGNSAYLPFLGYAPTTLSDGGSSTWNVGAAPTQIIGDTILGQTWQYGVKSSTYLYSDAAFAALPNATRLYAGQILAPPAYWNGANGKRYALDVVYQTGETGSPNGGATTCETNWTATGYQIASNITTITSSAPVVIGQVLRVYFPTASYFNGVNLTVAHIYGTTFDATGLTHADVSFTSDSGGAVNAYHDYICTSAVDLSYGQSIKVGTDGAVTISSIDASNPSNVLVNSGASGVGVYSTPTALSFAAPVLGPEIQFPTKSAAAPTMLAWSQGDMEQNSAAVANGICGWVNVAAGTPGTWTAIPCANATGQLNASQIVDTPSTSPECPNGVGGALTTVGCSVGSGTPTNTPAWLQYLVP